MHNGITLDAASVRDEINDRLQAGEITAAQAKHIGALSDEEINATIDASVDDTFWHAYDSARSDAIARLLRAHAVKL